MFYLASYSAGCERAWFKSTKSFTFFFTGWRVHQFLVASNYTLLQELMKVFRYSGY